MKRAMTVPWSLLWILGLICSSDSSCSPTSYYKSCWIRRYPGLYVDIEESQRRGAHILKIYQEDSALKCSRSCCLTPNFSCNLAVFHFNTTQDSVNCFHLRCPTAESCIPHNRGNVIVYNVTKGVDPDLLVFGKYFTTNVRVLPHMSSSRLNVSEPLTSDKRQFNYPPVRSMSPASTSAKKPTTPKQTTRGVPSTLEVQQNLPRCSTIPATTTQSTSEQVKSTTSLTSQQTTTTPQWASTHLHHITQTPSQTNEPDTTTSIPNPSLDHSTAAHPSSTIDYFDSTLTSIPINEAHSSSTTQQPLGLQTTSLQTTKSLVTASQNTMQSFTKILTRTQQPQTTSPSNSTLAKLEEYPEATAQTTVFKTVSAQTLTIPKPLTSANVPLQTSTQMTPAIQATTAQHVITTTSQPKMDSTINPTPQWKPLTSPNVPIQTLTQITPAFKTIQATTAQHVITTTSQPKMDSTINPTPQWKPLTSPNVPIQTLTQITPAFKTIQATTAQHVITTTSQPKMDSTINPTPEWRPLTSAKVPFQTSTQIIPVYMTSTPTQTTVLSQLKQTITTTDASTTPRHLTLAFTHNPLGNSPTTGSLSSSLTAPTRSVDSQPNPNDTKGYISRNFTTGDTPRPGGDGSLTSVWHLAANTVLVALAACATITFCCCCSVFAALSWRGRRRRKGRYRTNLRGKRGSMRLIKYVIVRESS